MRPVRHPGVVRGCTRSAILRTIVTGAVLMASASLVYLAARLWDSPVTAAPASAPGSRGEASASSEAGYERFVIEPAESQALYRVGEVFLNVNRPNVAVGVTQAIRGEILIDPRRLANSRLGTIQVDISQLTSDQPRRDQAIRERWLESARFPIAEFRVSSVEGLPDAYHEGVAVPVTLHGQLKIRTVERPVTFQGSFVLADNTLKGTARTTIRMTDFGFDPPSILGLLRAENEAEIQVEIVARRVG
ncbi:YceI family protein [Carboxydochorda subterranea]|uniref:YceI family protein n=1 Tax=Carboxydichorda subterranea TaxID=3109565 RepID=A0ABZ1C147_9FIRM|nr:YceI family protein [Limnochorda sp. L945t]WRP18752.1 YceI family protein [Limnochorda sp. L945t]